MTRLILVRHGQTDWNIEGRWQGHADVPMNARGREQIAQLAPALSGMHISAIYTSDLGRALETAHILAQTLEVAVHCDARLREIDQGEWQGMLYTNIQQQYAQEFALRKDNPMSVAPPGGESARQVIERAAAALHDIRQRHPDGTVAVVTHGFVIACVIVHENKLPIQNVWDLIPENGRWSELP